MPTETKKKERADSVFNSRLSQIDDDVRSTYTTRSRSMKLSPNYKPKRIQRNEDPGSVLRQSFVSH